MPKNSQKSKISSLQLSGDRIILGHRILFLWLLGFTVFWGKTEEWGTYTWKVKFFSIDPT